MSTTTLMKQETVPEWLHEWLNIPFYEGTPKCSKHNKYLTVFCGSCRQTLFCEVCWKTESLNHHGHPTVQVCIASHRAAVEKNAMKSVLDTSDIQEYVINHKKVVYLKPNCKAPPLHHLQHHCDKCLTCQRKLRDTGNYNFCSISCKVGISTTTSGQRSQCYIEENTKITRKKRTQRRQTPSDDSQGQENSTGTTRNEGRKSPRVQFELGPCTCSRSDHIEEKTKIMRKENPEGEQTQSGSQNVEDCTNMMRNEGQKRQRITPLELETTRVEATRDTTYTELESPREAAYILMQFIREYWMTYDGLI